MKLIDDWKQVWKWYSTHAMVIYMGLVSYYVSLEPTVKEQIPNWMPSAITMVMSAMFGAIIGALFIWAIPGENKDIVVYMAGQVSGILTSCVTYWVGSTRASANKDSLIRR